MNSLDEKEKKLSLALEKLKSFKISNQQENSLVADLESKKNQLEIEKEELKNKYELLKSEHEQLNLRFSEFEKNNFNEKTKQKEFTEKIDELNQETDTLLEEIDKWQT